MRACVRVVVVVVVVYLFGLFCILFVFNIQTPQRLSDRVGLMDIQVLPISFCI